MNLKLISALLILGISTQLTAQSKNRYQFAHSYLGIEGNQIFQSQNDPAADIPTQTVGRIVIGGTHFWNKADFYISFPVVSGTKDAQTHYTEGVITGARYLPFALRSKAPGFFVGTFWSVPSFKSGEGAYFLKHRMGFEIGINQLFAKSWSIELGSRYILNQEVEYYYSKTQSTPTRLPNFSIQLTVKKYVDFTAGLARESAQKRINKTHEKLDKQGRLSTFGFGIGFSSAFGSEEIPILQSYPFLPQKAGITLYPELGISYYLHKSDLAIRASYRSLKFGHSSYDTRFTTKSKNLGLEAFKFLLDYHGFVPFVGLGLDLSSRSTQITENILVTTDINETEFLPSLVFGWDIRPTDVEWYILRTNLRYQFPLSKQNRTTQFQILEVNFIQFVLYPGRIKANFDRS